MIPGSRAESIWTRYESPGGCDYANLWALSQSVAPRDITEPVERLRLLPVLDNPDAWIGDVDKDDEARFRFIGEVCKSIDGYLSSYFGSEYMPLFLRFYANQPGDDKPYAANWHCDAGPRKHAKVLIYLNDAEESGGNTEFLDHSTTMRLDETGYLFCDLDSRINDLTEHCKTFGIPYHPIRYPILAGEGVFFEPARIMHRAIWPTRGTRHMAQICFLPSPIPWQEACESFGVPFRDNAWRRFQFE